MFNIREVKNTKLVLKLNARIFPGDPLTIKPRDATWVCYLGDMPVGFACIRPLDAEPGSVFFNRAGLLPIAQGVGLHKRLIGVRLSWMKRKGYKHAITYTLQDNVASANNLAAMGFKIYTPEYLWADEEKNRECIYFYRSIK